MEMFIFYVGQVHNKNENLKICELFLLFYLFIFFDEAYGADLRNTTVSDASKLHIIQRALFAVKYYYGRIYGKHVCNKLLMSNCTEKVA